MSSISIQSSSRTWGSPTARVFRIGRDPASDIVTDESTVSRAHAELRPVGDGWEVVDLGSSLGTWVNGQRVERASLTGTTVIGFGDQGRGFNLTVTVTAPASPPPPPPPTGLPSDLDTTMISGPLVPPGGPEAPGAPASHADHSEQPGLLVRRRLDSDVRFGGHAPVRVGRDPQAEVVADDSAVSRLHAVIEPGAEGWLWTDHSTGGSFVDGERISTLLITEPTEISLGHPNAGYEIEVVPVMAVGQAVAAIARKKRQRALVVGGAALAVVLAVVGAVALGAAVTGEDPDQVAGGGLGENALDDRLDTAELDRAKAASVFLTAIDDSGNPMYTGSGSIISSDGLVLTNAHVGKPTAPGQGAIEGGDPAFLLVSVTSGSDDVAAEPTYRAEPIVADGYLDLAVLQITADATGNEIDPGDLDLPEPLPLGTSSDVRTGDEITALGYPAIGNVASQLSKPLTVTRGVVSTFQADPVIGTERGFIDSDVRLGSGNSGGPSINDAGEIIGINTAVITANSDSAGAITSGSALIRPVDLAADLLRIARDGGDPDYVSPYVDTLPRSDVVPDNVRFDSAGWVTDGDEGRCDGGSTIDVPQQMAVVPGELIYAEYLIRGVPDGTPIGVTLYSLDGTEILGSLQDIWSFGSARTCIYVPFEAPGDVAGVNGVFVVGEQAEPVVDNPLTYR